MHSMRNRTTAPPKTEKVATRSISYSPSDPSTCFKCDIDKLFKGNFSFRKMLFTYFSNCAGVRSRSGRLGAIVLRLLFSISAISWAPHPDVRDHGAAIHDPSTSKRTQAAGGCHCRGAENGTGPILAGHIMCDLAYLHLIGPVPFPSPRELDSAWVEPQRGSIRCPGIPKGDNRG